MRFVGLAAAFVGFAMTAAAPVYATPPIQCPPGQEPHPKTGQCVIIVVTPPTDPGDPGDPGTPPPPSDDKPPNRPVCTSTLTTPPKEIPCSVDVGWWVQSRQCYAKVATPQPPKSDPVWEGRTDGAIYDCARPVLGPGGFIVIQFWSAQPPGVGAPPDPRDLARRAVAIMNLRAIRVGMVPEPMPGRIGVVGMPTWMWAEQPDALTWGPVTRTAGSGGFTVTATAHVAKVVWSMGDGETVVCRSAGTPYRDKFGKKSSPDCGHTYGKEGMYRVRATSHWTVDWTGMGQSGAIPLTFSETAVVTIGEAQVLTQ